MQGHVDTLASLAGWSTQSLQRLRRQMRNEMICSLVSPLGGGWSAALGVGGIRKWSDPIRCSSAQTAPSIDSFDEVTGTEPGGQCRSSKRVAAPDSRAGNRTCVDLKPLVDPIGATCIDKENAFGPECDDERSAKVGRTCDQISDLGIFRISRPTNDPEFEERHSGGKAFAGHVPQAQEVAGPSSARIIGCSAGCDGV